ncbi:uncharacterized protein LOC131937682 [Physella acuta]|uniref:uncharacterized protein LOC131937682 n=1 Tax=Physella acuta TaxID=109671 RepID=UPI0027DE81C4|nr:uncharacterized protein LOC131937682 [Physella acuta]
MLQDNLSGLVDPDVLDIFLAISLVLESLLSIVGVAGNIISIVVFSQQGYRETTNISLTALALSDIGAILTLQLRSLMLNPWTLNSKLIFNPVDFSVMFSTYPHNYFIRSVFLAVVAVIRKLSVRGMYFDITVCCYCAIVLLENINSAVNPLVYYKMSKKYRDTCRKIFLKYLSNSL